jgi:hypothetical protein
MRGGAKVKQIHLVTMVEFSATGDWVRLQPFQA